LSAAAAVRRLKSVSRLVRDELYSAPHSQQ
jgi:hypothetical protein